MAVQCTVPSVMNYYFFSLAIRIGFERPNYTFFEPIFTERGFIDQVFLVKENNQLSEQTFQVEITVSDVSPTSNISPATLITRDPFGRIIDNDYRISGADQRSIILRFDPNREMISFNFVLYPDLLVEGTEAFVVNASPKQNTPAFSSPIFLAQNTFIIIEDNDCKNCSNVISGCIYINLCVHVNAYM